MEDNINNEITTNENNVKTKKRINSKFGIVLNVLIAFLLVALLLRIIFSIFFQGIYVVGDSMMPNFYGAAVFSEKGGDYVFINKFAKPEHGDVVVVTVVDEGEEKAIIKRVIGLEGDTLYLKNGQLFIKYAGDNGEPQLFLEEYIDEQYNDSNKPYNTTTEITVPENCMYLLGDNRNISKDSRNEAYGCFNMDALQGVVTSWSIKYKDTISNIYNFFKF